LCNKGGKRVTIIPKVQLLASSNEAITLLYDKSIIKYNYINVYMNFVKINLYKFNF